MRTRMMMQVKDRRETDVDCGGGECYAACGFGLMCATQWDCKSKLCSGGRCQEPATCGNGIKDGRETGKQLCNDVDCALRVRRKLVRLA